MLSTEYRLLTTLIKHAGKVLVRKPALHVRNVVGVPNTGYVVALGFLSVNTLVARDALTNVMARNPIDFRGRRGLE
jgi:hypothetical protein